MANWASPDERFVEVPGVVDIRWVSDDPEYYQKPKDLFDHQSEGKGLLNYGKKNKGTLEQAYFTCNVCECDLKSVVTLRAHCKGTQHIRKAIGKKNEYNKKNIKLIKKQQEGTKKENTEDFKTLFECLEQTSEPVVGLENITEYKSTKSSTPYYHCNLEDCSNAQGDCNQMKSHIMASRHKQSWLRSKSKDGVVPQTKSELHRKVTEYIKDYKRDYGSINIVEDDVLWEKCKKSQIRAPRVAKKEPERDSKEKERSRRDDWKRERSSLGRDNGERSSRGRDDRSTWESERISSRPREKGRSFKREGSYENRDSKRKRFHSRERSSRPHYRSRSRDRSSERRKGSEVKVDRVELDRPRSRDERKSSKYSEGREDLQVEEDHKITKIERDDREDGQVRNAGVRHDSASASNQPRNTETSQLQDPENSQDEIDVLYRKVTNWVKKCLDKYYKKYKTTEPKNCKINDNVEYEKLAKEFSHKMRTQIKESYEQYNRTLVGITLTEDNKEQIRNEIDMDFDEKPVI